MIDACNEIIGIVIQDEDLDGSIDEQGNIVGGLNNGEDIVGDIDSDGEVSGVIDISENIISEVSIEAQVQGQLHGTQTIQAEVRVFECDNVPIYDGDYEVTPKTNSQTIPTKDKQMLDDVLVKAIPYYETSNDYGTTVYIAGEL